MEEELQGYRQANAPKGPKLRRRTYDNRVIDEMLAWSAEGQTINEMLATWCIDDATFQRWCDEHEELRDIQGVVQTRAAGALERMLREAVKTQRAFPVALADKIIKRIEGMRPASEEDAAGLVRVNVMPTQPAAEVGARALDPPPGIALLAPR